MMSVSSVSGSAPVVHQPGAQPIKHVHQEPAPAKHVEAKPAPVKADNKKVNVKA